MSETIKLIELARLSPAERDRLLQRAESDLGPYLEKPGPSWKP